MTSATAAKSLRYHSLSILLHWTVVLGLVFMLASGLYMVNADISKADQYKLFQLHKAAGVIMLWALFIRICVRIFTKAPGLPSAMSNANKKKAKAGHLLLYVALVIMPLSGWVMVSASPFGLPTFVFVDWIKWPHIPGIARNKTVETVANNTHWITAAVLFTLIIGHIAAVIWHKKAHGLNLLNRMWWSKHKD
ncbi:cytochrome b [Brumicola nitratireducens]|uniref:Cytochrome B561 n=1 Tax=Glaciecola nitratireducens (strain JCM 12485 / KCTC 12276 / FR1064) TaxID=1085623 RepID=G4QEH2_GLANF|nr:cytochrome b [Glaciecola nitratireducens]AEP28735.1 cytochrome B561 [Glaciecola nitratireducens FR1064]